LRPWRCAASIVLVFAVLPWAVSLPESEATLGRIHVSFYKLQNGGFSLSVYSRRDGVHPDVRRDWPFIEDAVFCIAHEFERHRRRADALKAVAAAAPATAAPAMNRRRFRYTLLEVISEDGISAGFLMSIPHPTI